MRLKIGTTLLGVVIALSAFACTGQTSALYPKVSDGDPATVDRPTHWLNRAGSGGENTVLFVIDPSVPATSVRTSDGQSANYPALIRAYAAEWSKAANFRYVDATPGSPTGQTCTSASNCVEIFAQDRDGGGAGYCTQCVHQTMGPGGPNIYLSNRYGQMTFAFIAGMICHELGHTAGPLAHPPTGQGPCQNRHPTQWDLDLVAQNNAYHTH